VAREGRKTLSRWGDEVFLKKKKKKKIERGTVFVLFALTWFVPNGYRGVWATASGCVLAQYWVLQGTSQIQYHFWGGNGMYKYQKDLVIINWEEECRLN
jgi:hypothetical protein